MSTEAPETKPVVESFKDDPVQADDYTPAPETQKPVIAAFADDPVSAGPVPAATEQKTEKDANAPVEPITHGVLGYKGPGLVK